MVESAKRASGDVISMTGFGRSAVSDESGSLTVSIRSVNHRFLDLSVRLPEPLWELEPRVRALVSERLRRGKVEIAVRTKRSESSGRRLLIDEDLAVDAIHRLEVVARGLEIDEKPGLDTLLRIPGVVSVEMNDEDETWNQTVVELVETALDALMEMKRQEGRAIAEHLGGILAAARQERENLLALRDEARDELVSSFRKRLDDLAGTLELEIREDRLAQELALMAEKTDIEEELARIGSHLDQMDSVLEEGGEIGKKLDFLCQELNREVNTIGSKARTTGLRSSVVEFKTLVERLREQVQNVE